MSSQMNLMRRPLARPEQVANGCVGTIGTFDGVHIGHRRILSLVTDEAARRNLPAVVISFEPTPREFFSRGKPPGRLTRYASCSRLSR